MTEVLNDTFEFLKTAYKFKSLKIIILYNSKINNIHSG